MNRKPKIGEYLTFHGRRGKVICVWMHEGKLHAGLRFHGEMKITHVAAQECEPIRALNK